MNGVAFDSKSILKLLGDFRTLTGANITFVSFDYKFLVSLPDSTSVFCECLRKDKKANKMCIECDKIGYETVQKNGDFYLYECHVGLTEAITPMIDNGKIVGYLFMGQVLREKPTNELWKKIQKKCENYNVDFVELEDKFYKIPYLSMDKLKAAARIMDMSAKYICLSKMAKIQTSPLIEKVKDYIQQNLDKKISISYLAKFFNISQSHLCHSFKKEQNISISKYILMLRINKACELLEKTELQVKQIAEQVGLSEQNFFARTFKKYTGYTPTNYRAIYKLNFTPLLKSDS